MGYTKFGEYMRILRVKTHEVMGDAAKYLGVSVPFLSAVENGKKAIPQGWEEKIASHYSLDDDGRKELETAIDASRTQIHIKIDNFGQSKRAAALQFARSFDNMDEETAIKIMNLLENSGGK